MSTENKKPPPLWKVNFSGDGIQKNDGYATLHVIVLNDCRTREHTQAIVDFMNSEADKGNPLWL